MKKRHFFVIEDRRWVEMGLLGFLQVGFILLKVAGLISWSWWAVFTPLYIDIALITISVIMKYKE